MLLILKWLAKIESEEYEYKLFQKGMGTKVKRL